MATITENNFQIIQEAIHEVFDENGELILVKFVKIELGIIDDSILNMHVIFDSKCRIYFACWPELDSSVDDAEFKYIRSENKKINLMIKHDKHKQSEKYIQYLPYIANNTQWLFKQTLGARILKKLNENKDNFPLLGMEEYVLK